ncbi:HEAT repeat domain-containing protein [bacterium]|nr:HEAT repeat domain-containing protein [bacterium]
MSSQKIDFKEIVQVLKKGSLGRMIDAVDELGRDESVKAVGYLCDCLAHETWHIREHAHKLLKLKGNKIFNQIVVLLDSGNEDKIYWALQIMRDFPAENIESIIMKYLLKFENNPQMLVWIIKIIGKNKYFKSIKQLIKYFDHDDWNIRFESSEAVLHLGVKTIPYLQKTFQNNISNLGQENLAFWSMKTMGKLLKKKACKHLSSCLSAKNENIRYYGVIAFGETSSPEAVPYLIKMLADSSWMVRNQSAEILVSYGNSVVPQLKKALNSKNRDIRFMALRIIAQILKHESVPILEKVCDTGKKEMKFFAISALGEIRSKNAIKLLVKFFSDGTYMLRQHAANTLIKIGNFATPYVIDYLDSKDDDVFYWVTYVISNIGGAGLMALIECLNIGDYNKKKILLENLKNTREVELIPNLITLLNDEEWKLRRLAAEVLSGFGPVVIEPLVKAFEVNDSDINYWAVKILISLGDDVVARLVDIMRTGKADVRPYAVFTLAKISTEKSVSPIIEVLRENVEFECKFIITGVEDVEEESFFQIMMNTLSKEDDNTCFWVSEILSRIGRFHIEKLLRNSKIKINKIRFWIMRAIAQIQEESVIETVLNYIDDEDEDIRMELYTIISEYETCDKRIIDKLIKKIKEVEGNESVTLIDLVGKIAPKDALEDLFTIFESGTDQEKESLLNYIEDKIDNNIARGLIKMYEDSSTLSEAMVKKMDNAFEHFGRTKPEGFLTFFKEIIGNESDYSFVIKKKLMSFRKFINQDVLDFLSASIAESNDIGEKIYILREILEDCIGGNLEDRQKAHDIFLDYIKIDIDMIFTLLTTKGFVDGFKKMTVMQMFEELEDEIVDKIKELSTTCEDPDKIALIEELLGTFKASAGLSSRSVKKWDSGKQKKKSPESQESASGMLGDIESLINKTKRGG